MSNGTPPRWPGFPAGVHDEFEDLRQDLVNLHIKWNTYNTLFGTPQNFDLLNRVVPGFLATINEALLSDLAVSFCRILDPASLGTRDNLTLARLIVSLQPHVEPPFHADLQQRLQAIDRLCEPLRRWRNRKIGHKDLRTALQYQDNPLPNFDRADGDELLNQLDSLMQRVEVHFTGDRTVYHDPIQNGGPERLIQLVRGGR